MISDMFAPATHEQRVADSIRGSRGSIVMSEANALRSCSDHNRKEHRELIRSKLAECDEATRQRAELKQYRVQLEIEREQAIEDHAAEAAKIQGKLADTKLSVAQRIAARQELNTINTALSEAIADIEAKDFASEQEDCDLQVVCSARSTLERALRDTCEPELLAKLETAERTFKRLQHAANEAAKLARENPSATLKADAEAMTAICTDAAAQLATLKQQMMES